MRLEMWSYTRRYQIKAIFNVFPHVTVLFRQIGGYYFIFSMKGLTKDHLPGRKEYVQMEYLLNKELGLYDNYRQRKFR
ncbi:hypothetical protein [Planococcus lenghuensis]|uniref:Uncharacterized protein n=1 Tax=Planococcus lenghuensis TaxID=2213202 RepID=A0A1Q2L0B1_9BACL|nr:hypothetical protein [Planococcus lenghuensis]AQQ53497.1 hypothetical protein B0X71_10715 [Planococcus lenghuensis]